jgi:hypothetical protein
VWLSIAVILVGAKIDAEMEHGPRQCFSRPAAECLSNPAQECRMESLRAFRNRVTWLQTI